MLHIILAVFLILHGAVHVWYVVMARGLVPSNANTIWDGRSWLFTRTLGDHMTLNLATLVHGVTTLILIVAGVGLVAQYEWFATWAVAGAMLSIAGIVGFWDGKPDHPIEKGLLGIFIDAAILVAILYFQWPVI